MVLVALLCFRANPHVCLFLEASGLHLTVCTELRSRERQRWAPPCALHGSGCSDPEPQKWRRAQPAATHGSLPRKAHQLLLNSRLLPSLILTRTTTPKSQINRPRPDDFQKITQLRGSRVQDRSLVHCTERPWHLPSSKTRGSAQSLNASTLFFLKHPNQKHVTS